MTQQNAALVEQSAAAAESLKDQAVRLSDVMSIFRLDSHGTNAVTTLATPPRSEAPAIAAKPKSAVPSAPRVAAPHTPTPGPVKSEASRTDDWESF
jgi:methyl-accepting chemotaxis protein